MTFLENMILSLIFLINIFMISESEWTLIFAEEFNDYTFYHNWDVHHEDKKCDGSGIGQLNCKVNSTNNLRIIEGTLVLAAIREKKQYLGKDYTSATINTKSSFSNGLFEIRASLPNGKMLRPAIYLLPAHNSDHHWPRNGEIALVINQQTKTIANGIHFESDDKGTYVGPDSPIDENLNEFHNYTFEWSATRMEWKIDERVLLKLNVTKVLGNNYNPFNKAFKLFIRLGIGGKAEDREFFPQQILTENDVKQWNCSLLILDFVRVYQKSSKAVEIEKSFTQTNTSSADICRHIMPLIRANNQDHRSEDSNNSTLIISIVAVLSLLLLLFVIPIILYLFIKIKKLNQNKNNVRHNGNQNDNYFEIEDTGNHYLSIEGNYEYSYPGYFQEYIENN